MKRPKLRHITASILVIINIVLIMIMCISAYSGYIRPSKSALIAVSGLAFPLLLTINLMFTAFWFIFNWKMMLIPILGFLVCVSPALTFSPINVQSNKENNADSTGFSLLTYNVFYFKDNQQTAKSYSVNPTFNYILSSNADIVCLQEGYSHALRQQYGISHEAINELYAKYPFHTFDRMGLMLLSKYPISRMEERIFSDSAALVTYKLNINGKAVYVINVHLESIKLTQQDKELYIEVTRLEGKDKLDNIHEQILSKLAAAYRAREKQADEIAQYIDTLDDNVILCGDFNDVAGSYSYNIIKGNMKDAYTQCAFGPTITYNSNRFFFRIDQVFYRGNMEAISIKRGHLKSSDHYPLITNFAWK